MEEFEKAPVTVTDLDALVKEIVQLRKKSREMTASLSAVNVELEAKKSKMAGYLRELGRKSYKTEVGNFTLVEKWRVTLPKTAEDKHKLFDWLEERGLYDTYATVNSNSLNSLYLTEWDIAKKEGRGMEFEIPGIAPATRFETTSITGTKEDDEL
jgi:hypothetical protein